MMEVMTYNTEYGKRLPEIFQWLKTLPHRPDILCFQEFPENQIGKLNDSALFKETGFQFAPALVKYGKLHGELTAYDAEKVSLVRSKQVDLGEDLLERIYRKGSPSKRSALITSFITNKGIAFTIANIHLTAIGLHLRRRKQLTAIIRELESEPTIILGDFNYTDLIGGKGLNQLMDKFGYANGSEPIPTHRIRNVVHQLDYVFYKGYEAEDIRTENVPYSDHLPVFAKIRFPSA